MTPPVDSAGLPATEPVNWGISRLGQGLTDSAIRALSKRLAAAPGLVSFAGGMPSPDTFPVEAFNRAYERVMATAGPAALQYGPTDGFLPLREWIAASLPGATVSPAQVLITAGSQQGLDLIGKVLVDRGDPVAVETPTYLGALQSLGQYFPKWVPVDSDEHGLQPQRLQPCLRAAGVPPRGAKLLYTIPNFQNPTGRTLTEDRRRALVQACAQEGLPIVEDDPYGALDYAGRTHTSLLSMAPEQVIYLGSFSKVLSPGVRLGYLVAPAAIIRKLEQAKQASDLHTSTLAQRIVHEIVRDGFLDGHLAHCRQLYAARADAMDAALRKHLQGVVRWQRPEGGMFLWLELPPGTDAQDLIEPAIAAGVAFVPGAPFYAADARANTMRLCFSTASPAQIEQGIASLAKVLTG
jgi:2-aminoadipate transaminase